MSVPDTPRPPVTGIGLKAPHCADLLALRPPLAFLEIHAENYFAGDGDDEPGGPPHRWLEALRRHYPLSIHGVGLSLGSDEPLDRGHLRELAALVARHQPDLVSEHLAWSRIDGAYLGDLLPIPYTRATLDLVCAHVGQTQDALRRPILIENPSTYLGWRDSDWHEADFLAELCRRSGCGVLLDVNNLHVSTRNRGGASSVPPADEARRYLDRLPVGVVGEIHLAGHVQVERGGESLLIDSHSTPVDDAVWDLYALALRRFGVRPSLVEWDADVPALPVLLAQAARADAVARSLSPAPSSPFPFPFPFPFPSRRVTEAVDAA